MAKRFLRIGGQPLDRDPKTTFCVGIDTPVNYRVAPRHASGCDGKAPHQMGILEPRSEPCRLANSVEVRNKS